MALGIAVWLGVEANRHLMALALEEVNALLEGAAALEDPKALAGQGVRPTAHPRVAAPLWGEVQRGVEVRPQGLLAWAVRPWRGEALEAVRTYPLFLPSLPPLLLLALGASLWAHARVKGAIRRALGSPLEEAKARLGALEAAFSALEEGVMVLKGEEVVLLNHRGLSLLGLPLGALTPLPLKRVWPALGGLEGDEALLPLPTGRPARVRLLSVGAYRVAAFQEQAELLRLAEEFTQSRRHLELLRAQAHEFQNLLHVLGGLLELGQVEEALRLIQGELAAEKEVETLLQGIEVPLVAALVLGKLRRAQELGVAFRLEGRLPARYAPVGEELASAVGHLLENALEAAQSEVRLRFLERGEGLRVEVWDDGPGLPEDQEALFLPGASGRGAGRGYGLVLARAQVRALGGEVGYHRREGWTVFWLRLPGR